jgi:cysteine desulfurase
MKAYLDNAATTKVTKEVFEAMEPYLKSEFGNPSSLHNKGISNRKIINQSRKKVASLLGCDHKEIHFTSCGTESINWAIKGIASVNRYKTEIITTRIEHHATLHTCQYLEKRGYILHYLDVDEDGFIDIKQLKNLINENTLIVSVIMANNEIGTIQNIEEIANICDEYSTYLHVDAVQVATHIPIHLHNINADLVSFSGHKFHAPKGIGILYIKDSTRIDNLLHGGQQENDHRGGTENTAYIVGITRALELGIQSMEEDRISVESFSNYVIDELKKAEIDFIINGPDIGDKRLPGNLSVSFKDLDGSDLTYYLNKAEIYVSTGSACDSTSIEPSHVLQAINVPSDYIEASIRFSFSNTTTFEEVEYAVSTLIDIINE